MELDVSLAKAVQIMDPLKEFLKTSRNKFIIQNIKQYHSSEIPSLAFQNDLINHFVQQISE